MPSGKKYCHHSPSIEENLLQDAIMKDNYFCDISDTYLSFHDNLLPGNPDRVLVWSDTDWFDVTKIDNSIHEPANTYIVANALRWQIWMNRQIPVLGADASKVRFIGQP